MNLLNCLVLISVTIIVVAGGIEFCRRLSFREYHVYYHIVDKKDNYNNDKGHNNLDT